MAQIDSKDMEFLLQMANQRQYEVNIAEEYLKNTSPKTRRATVSEMAKEIISKTPGEIVKMLGLAK